MILLGSLLLLDQLDVYPFDNALAFFWPTIFAIIGVKGLIDNPGRNTIFKSGLVLVSGLLILRTLEIISFGWEIVFPFILIGLGLSFLIDNSFFNRDKTITEHSSQLDEFTMFGGGDRRVSSSDFRGGTITTVFGGIELDLTSSQLQEDALIDVSVVFGGVSLIIPAEWPVDIKVLPVFGGTEDTRPKADTYTAKKLTITGSVAFGGLEVKDRKKG